MSEPVIASLSEWKINAAKMLDELVGRPGALGWITRRGRPDALMLMVEDFEALRELATEALDGREAGAARDRLSTIDQAVATTAGAVLGSCPRPDPFDADKELLVMPGVLTDMAAAVREAPDAVNAAKAIDWHAHGYLHGAALRGEASDRWALHRFVVLAETSEQQPYRLVWATARGRANVLVGLWPISGFMRAVWTDAIGFTEDTATPPAAGGHSAGDARATEERT